MKERRIELDYNLLNKKIQERLEKYNKQTKNSPATTVKQEKKKTVNNEEGD
jgi:nucleosome binding factor SPN SPT16 subunit